MGSGVHKVATVAMVTGVLLGTSLLGYGVARGTSGRVLPPQASAPRASAEPSSSPAPTKDPREDSVRPTAAPAAPRASVAPVRRQLSAPLPAARPQVTPPPGPRLLGEGDQGSRVRDLQARLRQIAWWAGDVTDDYGTGTTVAVKGFQAKREIAVTGYVDQRTLDRLTAMTRAPTTDELANKRPTGTTTSAALDERCSTGRAMCIDKRTRTVRWVVDGTVLRTMSVRFGSAYTPTREGLFRVGWKSRDHVSKLYDSEMPFAMFFSGGQAVHYSSDFAARGYAGASHGCVNVRDRAGIAWLFDQAAVGDKVVIYWS